MTALVLAAALLAGPHDLSPYQDEIPFEIEEKTTNAIDVLLQYGVIAGDEIGSLAGTDIEYTNTTYFALALWYHIDELWGFEVRLKYENETDVELGAVVLDEVSAGSASLCMIYKVLTGGINVYVLFGGGVRLWDGDVILKDESDPFVTAGIEVFFGFGGGGHFCVHARTEYVGVEGGDSARFWQFGAGFIFNIAN